MERVQKLWLKKRSKPSKVSRVVISGEKGSGGKKMHGDNSNIGGEVRKGRRSRMKKGKKNKGARGRRKSCGPSRGEEIQDKSSEGKVKMIKKIGEKGIRVMDRGEKIAKKGGFTRLKTRKTEKEASFLEKGARRVGGSLRSTVDGKSIGREKGFKRELTRIF